MAYKAPEGAGGGGGGGGGGGRDAADADEDEGETAPLGSGDVEDTGDEPGEGERLSGEGGKSSAATEEASVDYY